MSKVVQLRGNQKAERGECGSCVSFSREDHDDNESSSTRGHCCFKLPPMVPRRTYDVEAELPPDMVADTHSCDLYRPSDATFSKVITWIVK